MNILFICTGNTCRSPMAEGYLKSLKLENVAVKSCGLSGDGLPVSENSATAMNEINIDISSHISKQLTSSEIAWADKIICMSLSHKTVLNFYADREKISVLADGIPDPYGMDISAYRACRDSIISAIDDLLKREFFFETEILTATKEHFKEIAELEKTCFSSPWNEEMLLDAYNHGTKFFVAIKNKRVLGYVGINCVLDEGYITNIAVSKNQRNKGIATSLINRIFSLASDLKLSFISLEVRVSNSSAISLYEKAGFKQEGKRKDFYTLPKEDALIMTKRF